MTSQEQESTVSDGSNPLEHLCRRLSEDHPDETEEANRSAELTAILTHVVHDQSPSYSLKDVVHALAASGASSDLDALHVVPLLLNCEDPSASEILSLLAQCGNAKETVISVQESLERLHHDLTSDEELDEDSTFLRLGRLLLIYIEAIPRLKLRKRSTSDTIRPLFADISPVIQSASPFLQKRDGRRVIRLVCNLLSCATMWASQQDTGTDLPDVKAICRTVLSSSLSSLSSFLETTLAQQKFEACNPWQLLRLWRKEVSDSDTILQECLDVAVLLSYTCDTLLYERTTGSLALLSILISNSTSLILPPRFLLAAVLPTLITALQSNTCIDASLNILLHVLYPSTPSSGISIDPDHLDQLCAALASLASTSPDPGTRLIAFRTLGALLAQTSPLERMTLLRDLLTESPFPSLRVATVGLLKGAVLEALTASPSSDPNPFASPDMLRTFGSIVLRPDPPELFSKPASRESLHVFIATQESRRLVECLAFFYVLLMRDERNVTGARDPSQVRYVERGFLSPLRDALRTWEGLLETDDEYAEMALAGLQTSLERIDEAYEKLDLKAS